MRRSGLHLVLTAFAAVGLLHGATILCCCLPGGEGPGGALASAREGEGGCCRAAPDAEIPVREAPSPDGGCPVKGGCGRSPARTCRAAPPEAALSDGGPSTSGKPPCCATIGVTDVLEPAAAASRVRPDSRARASPRGVEIILRKQSLLL